VLSHQPQFPEPSPTQSSQLEKRTQLCAEEATKRAAKSAKKRRVLEVNIFVVFLSRRR
jgi:hypothetical protein